ncbi:MAG: helix-turn-helix domain-containing protein [archaeon]
MNYEIFEKLGLTKNETKVYFSILENGSSTAGVITETTGIHRRNVYDCIERLIEKGLVGYIHLNGKKYFEVVDPKCFQYLFNQRREEIETQHKKFLEIFPQLESTFHETKGKYEITYYRGIEAINLLLSNILDRTDVNYVMGAQNLYEPFDKYIKKYHEKRIKKKNS